MKRDIFSDEHELFREQFRRFAAAEIEPKVAEWNARGMSDRGTWRRCGEEGFLGANQPEAYGGAGADFLYDAILMEELSRIRAHALMLSLHSDIVMPYLVSFGSEDQKRRFVPKAISGECILGIAMTEPGTGSDLANVQTRALRDGDAYVLNGSKTFISNGQIADLFVVVAKTDPEAEPPHRGITLFLVEADRPGFVRGRKLPKIGLQGQDTSELFFQDCRVPAANRLGQEGQGFKMLMEKLAQERLTIAVMSMASSQRALEDTLAYVKERQAFGQPIGRFQNTQFKLAELATEVEVGQAFVDKCLVAHVRGENLVSPASMAKWWTTDLQKRLTSECLQLHGGYGFMEEVPISGDYCDAAVQSIYAGTNEIMKVIIARHLGLGSVRGSSGEGERPAPLRTRVSELLGVDYPIVQAPMGWIARARLASAVSNAGGLGVIETSSGELDAVREEIRKMRDLTDKPFGVNIAQLFVRDPGIVDFVVAQGVRFVTTSAGDPTRYTKALKEAGLTVFHVVPTLRAARKAIEAGVDGLVVEGGEGGGFKNPRDVASMVLLPLVCSHFDVPVIAAGGMLDGCTMAAAFALGAEGIQMGTRMVSAEESPVHENFKKAICEAAETDTVFLNRHHRPGLRALRTGHSERLEHQEQVSLAELGTVLQLYFGGDMEASIALSGQVAGRIDRVRPVAEILRETVAEFYAVAERLGRYRPV